MTHTRIPSRIFLVGPMGAGKTSVGRDLARRLGREFLDVDHELERRTGVSIPWIFDVEGEAGFRRREAEVIDELTQRDEVVLATGGGAVTTPANRDVLGARGVVVYLYASVAVQAQRTQGDRHRPMLHQGDEDPTERLETLMAERDPLYRSVADVVIETSGGTARSVADELIEKLSSDTEQSTS